MRVWPGNRLSADHRMRFKDVLRKAFGVLRVIFFFFKAYLLTITGPLSCRTRKYTWQ